MSKDRLNIHTTPTGRLHLDSWLMPDLSELNSTEKQAFFNLKDAISYYVSGGPITRHLKERKIHPERFMRAYDRCVSLDERGQPFGWRGLYPRIEVRPRQRKAPLCHRRGSKGGLSGSLQLYLRENPDVRESLAAYMDRNAYRRPGGEAGVSHKSVHREFQRLCAENDPQMLSWPFTTIRRAAGAIRAYVEQYLVSNYDRIVATQYGDKAATKAKSGTGHEHQLVASMPFDIVEMDEHSAGFTGGVRIETPEGHRFLETGRVTILLLVDRFKGWVLSFKVVFRDAANAGDAMDVLHAGMVGEPGYAHRTNATLGARPLVDLDEHFAWCGFNSILLDNALIHLADALTRRVMALTGCAINFGPVKTPARRQLVERIFNALERAGFKRLRGTMGSGPQDPKRQKPGEEVKEDCISEREIIGLIGSLVRQYNNNIGKQNLAASPYQRMSSLISGNEQGSYLFPFSPPLFPNQPDLSVSEVLVKINGSKKSGRRPYFTFLDCDYTCPELAKNWSLLGEWVTLHVKRSALRTIRAFHRGNHVGTARASGRWGHSEHSIDLRKYINQLLRTGYLACEINEDVVAKFIQTVASTPVSPKAERSARTSARQAADHSVTTDASNDNGGIDAAAPAVNDLLDRVSSPAIESHTYAPWDDIGAFNGGDHD